MRQVEASIKPKKSGDPTMPRNTILLAATLLLLPAAADAQRSRAEESTQPSVRQLTPTAERRNVRSSGPGSVDGAVAPAPQALGGAQGSCVPPPGLGGARPDASQGRRGPPAFAGRGGPGACGVPVCEIARSACRGGGAAANGGGAREWEDDVEREEEGRPAGVGGAPGQTRPEARAAAREPGDARPAGRRSTGRAGDSRSPEAQGTQGGGGRPMTGGGARGASRSTGSAARPSPGG